MSLIPWLSVKKYNKKIKLKYKENRMNRHIKKISNVTIVGSMSALVIATLTGCGDTSKEESPKEPTVAETIQKDGATITIKESIENNKTTYKILDEIPSVKTRVILQDVNVITTEVFCTETGEGITSTMKLDESVTLYWNQRFVPAVCIDAGNTLASQVTVFVV